MKITDLMFDKNGQMFQHLTKSFNKLLAEDIPTFLMNSDNMFYVKMTDTHRYQHQFRYSNIRIVKPMLKNNIDKMYPQYARLNHLTYACTIIADISQYQVITNINTHDVVQNMVGDELKNQVVTKIPLMLQSQYCNLQDDIANKHKYGECKYDYGGYFIINGAEKVVIPQNRLTDNKMLVFQRKETNQIVYICQVNSKPAIIKRIPQIISIRIDKSKKIILQSPVFQEVSIVVILKALGLVQDADIFNAILQGSQNNEMIRLIDQLINNYSIDDYGEVISTQEHAVIFLTNKAKVLRKFNLSSTISKSGQNKMHIEEILSENFLPHLTCDNISKAYYVCNMIKKLLHCFIGLEPVDDRDSYVNKRIDMPGDLIFDLFKQYHKKMIKEAGRIFNQRDQSDDEPANIIEQIKSSPVEQNIKLALVTGQWPKQQTGVSQMLQRQTYLQPFSLMRRIDTPSGDATSQKLVGPRMVHASTTGFLCVVSTPEHASVGRIRHLSIISTVTVSDNKQHTRAIEYVKPMVKQITDIVSDDLYKYFRVYVNGDFIGITKEFWQTYQECLKIKLKYNETGIVLDVKQQEIRIYTDSGRLIRPVLKVKNNTLVMTDEMINSISFNKEDYGQKVVTFLEFMKKYPEGIENVCMEEQPFKMIAYNQKKLIEMKMKREDIARVLSGKQPLHDKLMSKDMFNVDFRSIQNRHQYSYCDYTLCELHESLLQAEIPINIPFMNSNQGPRNIFQYSQGRQAQNIYSTNHNERFDNTFVLSKPTQKLITTLPSKYTNGNILTPGQTIIVAISTFKGLNQEDSNVMNESSVQRGMFRAHNYRKYYSVIEKNFQTNIDGKFGQLDPETTQGIGKIQNNNKLNKNGYVPEETPIRKGDALIGKMVPLQQTTTGQSNFIYKNESEYYRSIVPATVDKVVRGHNVDGYKFIKMKIRQERRPFVGDKFSSCFTRDHEIMTENGWVNIKQFTTTKEMHQNVRIACFKSHDAIDGNIELVYDYVDGITVQKYDGDLISIQNNNVSVVLTPNHRLLAGDLSGKNWKEQRADKMFDKKYTLRKNATQWNPNYKTMQLPSFLVLNDDQTEVKYINENQKVPVENYLKYVAKQLDSLEQLPKPVFYLNQKQSMQLIILLLEQNKKIELCHKKLADDLTQIALHAGISADVIYDDLLRKWIVQFMTEQNNVVTVNNDEQENKYICSKDYAFHDGYVYCVTAKHGHNIYIRNSVTMYPHIQKNTHGQKSTCGGLLASEDLYYNKHGMTPDLILNPNAIPSRMTIGQLMESITSKLSLLSNTQIDGTPFMNLDMEEVKKRLGKTGFMHDGTEILYNGETGESLNSLIFIGPTHYCALKHIAMMKCFAVSKAQRVNLTRGVAQGRSTINGNGGLRIGEMERDAIVAHGMSQFLREKLLNLTDAFKIYICEECGYFAQRRITMQTQSQMRDNDQYVCSNCQKYTKVNPTIIPYAFKLLLQELQAINVQASIKLKSDVYERIEGLDMKTLK